MSKTKAGGTSKLGRDSQPKYLGVKLYEGQPTKVGSIIIRQRGARYLPGINVRKGKDDTIYAVKEGTVHFSEKRKKSFNGSQRKAKVVNVKTK